MMNLVIDLGLHGAPSLFHVNNGFHFRCYRVRGLTAYLRCTEYRHGCPARGQVMVGEYFQLNNDVHNHEPNLELLPYLEERRMLIEQAKRLDIASFQEIFQHQRLVFDEELANSHMYNSMLRARMDVLPKLLSLRDLLNALENPSYTCISATGQFNEILFTNSCRLSDGTTVLLFMSPRCTAFLRMAPDVFIVQTVIGGNYDLLTIGCLWEKRVLCLGFLLMDGRTAASFNSAMYLLRTHLHTWNFQEVICGEAHPLPSTVLNIFAVPVYPSLFDFIRDARLIIPEGVMHAPHAKYLLGLCFKLTLLPEDIIPVGMLFIQAEFIQLQANNRGLSSIMERILKMPHFLACAEKDRSHYGIVFLKDQQNRQFSNFNGNFYAITRYIVSSTETSLRKIDSIERAEPPVRSRPKSVMEDNQSQQLFKDLIRPPLNLNLSIANFMRAMTEKLKIFLQ